MEETGVTTRPPPPTTPVPSVSEAEILETAEANATRSIEGVIQELENAIEDIPGQDITTGDTPWDRISNWEPIGGSPVYDNLIIEGATGPKNPQSSGILTPQEIEEIKLKVHVKQITKRLKESQDAANQIRNRYQIVVQELQRKEDQLKQEKSARTKKEEDVKNLKEENLALQSEKDNRIHWQDRATDLSNKLAKVTSVKENEYEEINKILRQVIVERDQEREQNRDRLAKQVDKTLEAKE